LDKISPFGIAHGDDGRPAILHDVLHVTEVPVDNPLVPDNLCNGLCGRSQHLIRFSERLFDGRGVVIVDFQKPLVVIRTVGTMFQQVLLGLRLSPCLLVQRINLVQNL